MIYDPFTLPLIGVLGRIGRIAPQKGRINPLGVGAKISITARTYRPFREDREHREEFPICVKKTFRDG